MPPISLVWCLPFVAMLGSIAILPFINKHWWEKWYPAVACGLALISLVYYAAVRREMGPFVHELEEYISFICLLGALFIVSGGIVITVTRKATPLVNCILLLVGAVIANLFGTTGAAMLLIRPYLAINKTHLKPYHVVFFIFVVANVGGSLTPIGDPPLFLGYLRGVPFWWVFDHCWPAWLFTVGALLAIFFVVDTLDHRQEERVVHHHGEEAGPAVHLRGMHNLIFIFIVVGAVFREGVFDAVTQLREVGVGGRTLGNLIFNRELLMAAAAVASRKLTPRVLYEHNGFTFGPIKEVAILFIGIFLTMAPALEYLKGHAADLPLRSPGRYFFTSGTLSSMLDNAPTYATFLETRLGDLDNQDVKLARAAVDRMAMQAYPSIDPNLPPHVKGALNAMLRYHETAVKRGRVSDEELQVAFLVGDEDYNAFLVAISLGSVFFGACTYIGNGPNFMVKSIADTAGAHSPGFFAYLGRFALPVLLPVYIVVWLLFLR